MKADRYVLREQNMALSKGINNNEKDANSISGIFMCVCLNVSECVYQFVEFCLFVGMFVYMFAVWFLFVCLFCLFVCMFVVWMMKISVR